MKYFCIQRTLEQCWSVEWRRKQQVTDMQTCLYVVMACRTRKEFEKWGKGLAEEHGYTVKFWGAGKAMEEGKALTALSLQGQDLGFASQVNCFALHCPALSSLPFAATTTTVCQRPHW